MSTMYSFFQICRLQKKASALAEALEAKASKILSKKLVNHEFYEFSSSFCAEESCSCG